MFNRDKKIAKLQAENRRLADLLEYRFKVWPEAGGIVAGEVLDNTISWGGTYRAEIPVELPITADNGKIVGIQKGLWIVEGRPASRWND